MRVALVALALVGLAFADPVPCDKDTNDESFADWKKNNNETSADKLENFEHHIMFDVNKQYILAYNNETGAHLKINDMAGLTPDELKHRYFGLDGIDPNDKGDGEIEVTPAHRAAWPASLDWRNKNGRSWLSSAQNQNPCGSCYAFATLGALESRYAIKNNAALPDFAEQDVVDCGQGTAWPVRPGKYGCDGGTPAGVIRYVKAKGAQREAMYPYTKAYSGTCKASNAAGRVPLKFKGDAGYLVPRTEDEVIQALQDGPVPMCITITGNEPFMYLSKKDTSYTCRVKTTPTNIEHAIMLVGYTPDFWIIKNSWGNDWGQNGYMNIPRRGDPCGIIAAVTVPVLA